MNCTRALSYRRGGGELIAARRRAAGLARRSACILDVARRLGHPQFYALHVCRLLPQGLIETFAAECLHSGQLGAARLPEQITAYVAVTDRDWFDTLSAQGPLDEVNFWQPSASAAYRAPAESAAEALPSQQGLEASRQCQCGS